MEHDRKHVTNTDHDYYVAQLNRLISTGNEHLIDSLVAEFATEADRPQPTRRSAA